MELTKEKEAPKKEAPKKEAPKAENEIQRKIKKNKYYFGPVV